MGHHSPFSLNTLLDGYRVCAESEGKSRSTVTAVTCGIRYLDRFLCGSDGSSDVREITPHDIRRFILHLQQKRCFEDHPLIHPQDRGLAGHTINGYLRAVRVFFSWLVAEGLIDHSPFERVKVPRAPLKVIPTFSESQLRALFGAIETSSAEGYRDHTLLLMILDSGLRVSELTGLLLCNLHIEDGLVKVKGKGNKERTVPIGRKVARQLWRYVTQYRARPARPRIDNVFLTRNGEPMTKDRIEKRMAHHGRKAGLEGIRCSPHTLRHTAAITFLRNGGDVFSLQRMLGHTSLEMTRRYCQVADTDLEQAHRTASPVDNLHW